MLVWVMHSIEWAHSELVKELRIIVMGCLDCSTSWERRHNIRWQCWLLDLIGQLHWWTHFICVYLHKTCRKWFLPSFQHRWRRDTLGFLPPSGILGSFSSLEKVCPSLQSYSIMLRAQANHLPPVLTSSTNSVGHSHQESNNKDMKI